MTDQVYSIEPIIIDQGELELQIHLELTILYVDKAKRVIALQKIKDSIAAEVLKVFGKKE